jgi:hypothetical protein
LASKQEGTRAPSHRDPVPHPRLCFPGGRLHRRRRVCQCAHASGTVMPEGGVRALRHRPFGPPSRLTKVRRVAGGVVREAHVKNVPARRVVDGGGVRILVVEQRDRGGGAHEGQQGLVTVVGGWVGGGLAFPALPRQSKNQGMPASRLGSTHPKHHILTRPAHAPSTPQAPVFLHPDGTRPSPGLWPCPQPPPSGGLTGTAQQPNTKNNGPSRHKLARRHGQTATPGQLEPAPPGRAPGHPPPLHRQGGSPGPNPGTKGRRQQAGS